MKTKWYFGVLLLVFTFLGIYQNKVSETNQEIVLKFADVNITNTDAETTIGFLKQKLNTIGIKHVRVKELKNGQFKIAYYSKTDVASIKALLSKEKDLNLGLALNQDQSSDSNPNKSKSKSFKLDVYEIQKTIDSTTGLGGKCILSLNKDYDRFTKQNIDDFGKNSQEEELNEINIRVAFKLQSHISIEIEGCNQKIPEVRAGPCA